MDAPKLQPSTHTFAGCCVAYLGSTGFAKLAPRTKALNRMYVDRLRDAYGRLPATAITRPVVVTLRETNASRPWYAARLLATLRIIMRHAVDLGVVKTNPAEKPGGLDLPHRTAVWTGEQTAELMAAARPAIRLAAALLLYTAQRPSDVLAMTRGQISERDGRMWLTLRQQKTNELVTVPVHRDLEDLLRARLAVGGALLLVPSPRGLPWAYRNFCRAWDADCAAAGIVDVQRRDLRRTAMVRMAEAGATTPQIAAVSGHSIDQTGRILDTYIPRRGEVAAGAIAAWEGGARSNVVSLPGQKKAQ